MKHLSIIIISIVLAACGGQAPNFESRPEVKASRNINESFSFSNSNDISIQKSALEKEFLLQSSLIFQELAPQWSGLKSRIVAFKKRGSSLYMLESSQGHVVSKEVPSNLVLAEFPITAEDAGSISFDFNKGMSRLFLVRDWHASDFGLEMDKFLSYNLEVSYLEDVSSVGNALIVRQVAQLSLPDSSALIPIEAKYFLTPYEPEKNFQPSMTTDFEKFGFFEVMWHIGDHEDMLIYASKHDHQKPIQFHVSANTPAEYLEAVKEGVLYWNKAFGKEVVKVDMAPATAITPDFEHNMVQWVTFNSAGFAYADAQMDPRTGQILHSQVFLTSAFAFSGRGRARLILKRIEEEKSAHKNIVSLKGFESKDACNFKAHKSLKAGLTKLLADETLDDATILRISQDYVRLVTAHEIGHNLGLRHNFAGSLATNYSLSLRKALVEGYAKTNTIPVGTIVTSSVMDYLVFEEDAIAGSLMKTSKDAYGYDKDAIQYLYNGVEATDKTPLYCSDLGVGEFQDCEAFDTGASYLEFQKFRNDEAPLRLPEKMLMLFVIAKSGLELGGKDLPMDDVQVSAQELLSSFFWGPRTTVLSLKSDLKLLGIHRKFSSVGPLNEEEVRAQQVDYVTREINRLGGLQAFFPSFDPNYPAKFVQEFEGLLKRHATGIGMTEKPYAFTEAEQAQMISIVKKLAAKMPNAFAEMDVALLNTVEGLDDTDLAYEFAKILDAKAREYVLSSTQTTIPAQIRITEKGATGLTTKYVNLPVFTYPQATRKAAMTMLTSTKAKFGDWGLTEREALKEDVTCAIEGPLGGPVFSVELRDLDKPTARWVLDQKEVTNLAAMLN